MEQTAKEVVLTYETLYELLRREKSRDELQQLDEQYFRDTLTYLKEKQQAYDDNLVKNDIFSQSERDKLQIQLANIKKIIRDLYDIRERKIINMAINHTRTNAQIADTAHLIIQEKALYDSIVTALAHHRTSILLKLLEQRMPDIMPIEKEIEEPIQETTTKKVKFTEKVDQFVDEELETYGPYEAEQEAELPPDLANILISQGKAAGI